MHLRSSARAILFVALSVCISRPMLAQEKALTRTFVAGAEERYQVNVAIRIETHGVSTEKVGDKAYTDFYTHEASGEVSWRSTRKIISVNPEGTAAVEEVLDHFVASCDKDPTAKSFNAALQKSVRDTCANWQSFLQMNYEEEKLGLIRGLPSAVGDLTGSDSPLFSLWLRRAFRPGVILPKGPLNFGYRAAHKISNPYRIASNPEGEELVEWLDGPADPPAAILHVSQNLTWANAASQQNASTVTDKPNKRQIFYSDSLNTISLLDGSLLKASRSASHETKDTLEPVPGLPDPPAFGSKLTITVTILRLP